MAYEITKTELPFPLGHTQTTLSALNEFYFMNLNDTDAASSIAINHAGSIPGTSRKPSGLSISIGLNSSTISGQ